MKSTYTIAILAAVFMTAGISIPVLTAYSANNNQAPSVAQVSTVVSCVMGVALGFSDPKDCDLAIKRDFPQAN
jgi:hypothetical protein